MKTFTAIFLLSLITLALCTGDSDVSLSAPDSHSAEDFFVKRDLASSFVPRRQKRNAQLNLSTQKLESLHEVCELNTACNDLSDTVGIIAAYQRHFGPIPV
ncbi:osteocalcin [Polyodon spathula]|uniref:osteocalcin n=1 Tax=Polyodon spathula TaxID=7913 RepID=UPI001B7F78BC|nr:osteocalcin [Polyodon spathula]